jgi:hypothetical protein
MISALDGLYDYVLSPKEIESTEIKRSKDRKALVYDDPPSFDSEKRYRLNEPFLSALIEYIFRNITDIGTPDYSNYIKDSMKNVIKNMENNQMAAKRKFFSFDLFSTDNEWRRACFGKRLIIIVFYYLQHITQDRGGVFGHIQPETIRPPFYPRSCRVFSKRVYGFHSCLSRCFSKKR